MPLFRTIKRGYHWGWSLPRCGFCFVKGVMDKFNLFRPWIFEKYTRYSFKDWLKTSDDGSAYFDFKGAKIPYIEPKKNACIYETMQAVFQDTFGIYCLYDDHYTPSIVKKLDPISSDGPYGYTDGSFDVTVKEGDVVIDAGAWIGDFSAYAAAKKAVCYAFEPLADTYALLQATAAMNNTDAIYIIPVDKGLSDRVGWTSMDAGNDGSGAGASMEQVVEGAVESGIAVTTIDEFVKAQGLQRVDFIKADIEGAERDMLRGARETLKRFAPKLAICTYHLPDDPQVLEQIIKEANPDYTVVHTRHKLMAMVVK